MKLQSYIYSLLMLAVLLAWPACGDDMLEGIADSTLTPEQRELIGQAVNFDASRAEEFTTRTTWISDGRFNEGDLMTIYRQYWDTDKTIPDWSDDQAYRTYIYDYLIPEGTTISLGKEWKVKEGRYMSDNWRSATSPGTERKQTKADSLTWENGKTVRFRAWSRSNYSGSANTTDTSSYYPDYCIADWVTVSGPTQGIPLTLRHVTSRIAIDYRSGNEFYNGEICLDTEAYLWDDNADSYEKDGADKYTQEQAEAAVESVRAVYYRMCMPAGVDVESRALRTMTRTLYESMHGKSDGFPIIDRKTTAQGIVNYGDKTPEYIKEYVKHPTFSKVNSRLYMITIPYDMSNDPATKGDVLTLPACTRFRIRLRDINHGDVTSHPSFELKEHIFALSDITVDGKPGSAPMFPEGLPLIPGKSYRFVVGYQYDRMTVTVIEEGIDWSEQPTQTGHAIPKPELPDVDHEPYVWWTGAINTAIRQTFTTAGHDYNPIFRISSREEFQEFVALVNGTYNIQTSGLERALRGKDYPNPDADPDLDKNDTKFYWWYDVNATTTSLAAGGDTVWVSRQEAVDRGYVFYRHYYPQISDRSAYSIEEYIRGPYSFYDESVDLHLVVQLTQDLDLADWEIEAIGKSSTTPFKGFFDGGTHTLSDVNVSSGSLFGYVEDGEIRDLRLTSTHPLAVLSEGRASGTALSVRIVGVSLQADAVMPPFGQSLMGRTYLVGCIHEGKSTVPLVGSADNLTMLGCMHASPDLTGAALLGQYAAQPSVDGVTPGVISRFFSPQTTDKVVWGRFMCNYYQRSPLQPTYAVGGAANDSYKPQQYIRGSREHILKALNDNLLADETPYDRLSDYLKQEYYGLAPWRAMNYAIAQYNKTSSATSSEYQTLKEDHKCHMKYQVSPLGYEHRYPQLLPAGEPDAETGRVTAVVMAGDYGNIENILYLNN